MRALPCGPVPKDRPLGEVTDIVQRNIVPQLTSVANVQRVENSGVKPAMRIWMNAWKMAALNVTAHDIKNTLQSNNVIGAWVPARVPPNESP